jgi:hypothetical protein
MELIRTISCVESKPIQTPYIHWELTINRITEIAKIITTTKKFFRTGYIKDLAPVIQPVLKLCGAKYFKNRR